MAAKKIETRLFDHDGSMNNLGTEVCRDFESHIEKWVKDKLNEGIDLRDLQGVMDIGINIKLMQYMASCVRTR